MVKEGSFGNDLGLLGGMYQKIIPLNYVVHQNSPKGGDEKESWNSHMLLLFSFKIDEL